MNRHIVPLALGLLACLSWALGTVATKHVLATIPPLSLLAGQVAASTVFLAILCLIRRVTIHWSDWRIGLAGLLQPALVYACSLIGLSLIPASLESMIFAAETPLIMLLAWPLLRETPSKTAIIFGGLSFIGVVLLSWQPDFDRAPTHGLGIAFVLAGVVFAALYSIAIRRMSAKVDALRLTTACQIVGALAVGFVWLLGGDQDLSALSWLDGLLVIGSGLLLNGIPLLLYGIVLERTSATFAALMLPLVPVLTAALAFVLLGEMLTPLQWGGALIVLSCVTALAIWNKSA